MPAPSVTYSFSNGSTADASQVNQNFTDLINGVSDGTKDLSINGLTVAGAASFNGNVTLGNASGDDVTVTGSLASSIAIKTTNSYSIGSSTLGLASMYFGANSQTVRLLPSPSMSATWTFTLPVTAGTANYPLITDGSGVTSWTAWSLSAWAATTSALGTVYHPNSMLQIDTGNGTGTTPNYIRRFSGSATTTGNAAITYLDTAATGATFTAAQAGVYGIFYSDYGTGGRDLFGISLNSAQLTTQLINITSTTRFMMFSNPAANEIGSGATHVKLAVNDVIRCHGNSTSGISTADETQLIIVQLFRTS
jgi:hypothetical protein